jgi:hypothetical protein
MLVAYEINHDVLAVTHRCIHRYKQVNDVSLE